MLRSPDKQLVSSVRPDGSPDLAKCNGLTRTNVSSLSNGSNGDAEYLERRYDHTKEDDTSQTGLLPSGPATPALSLSPTARPMTTSMSPSALTTKISIDLTLNLSTVAATPAGRAGTATRRATRRLARTTSALSSSWSPT